MSSYCSDEYDVLGSEYSTGDHTQNLRFKTAVFFNLDECETKTIWRGIKAKLSSLDEPSIHKYAELNYPNKCVHIVSLPSGRHDSAILTFVVLSNSFDFNENVFIIPDKTFEDISTAEYEYNGPKLDFHCFVLPNELSHGDYINDTLRESKEERDAMVLQIFPEGDNFVDEISYIAYEGLNVCFLGYVRREPILVKIRYHKSPFVKEKIYMDCFTSDKVGKIVQYFKRKHPSHLEVKLSFQSKLLEEYKPIGSYQTFLSTLHNYEQVNLIFGATKPYRPGTLKITAHLVSKSHIPMIFDNGYGRGCIVFVDRNGSTKNMRSAVADVVHKDPASFRILIKDTVVPELMSLTSMSDLKELSVIKLSTNSMISLLCHVSDENIGAFVINVFPYPSKALLYARISEKLKLRPFLFDLFHDEKPLSDILSEKDLYQTNEIVIEIKRKRQKIKYIISTAFATEMLERKGCLVIDDSKKTTIIDVLQFYSAYLNVDPVDLRVIESGRCHDHKRTLEDIGISESSTVFIASCVRLLHNDEYITTQITGDAEGMLRLTEVFMMEGIPVFVPPSFPMATYKERLLQNATKRKEKKFTEITFKGLQFLEKTSIALDSRAEGFCMDEEDIQKAKTYEKRVSEFEKRMLLRKARKVRSKISKSDGEYSDTFSETRSVQDVPVNTSALKAVRHSRSENDIKEINKRKGRVSFNDMEDTESNSEKEPVPWNFSEMQKPVPCNTSPFSPSIMTREMSGEDVQVLKREHRETLVFKQGGSYLERETLVRNKVLPLTDISVQDIARPAKTELPEDYAESSILQMVADEIGRDWKKVGRHLNMKESDFENIESNNNGLHERAFQMLITWKRRNGSNATNVVLIEALKNCELVSVAELVRENAKME